jgi:hypothetical protein
MILLEKEKQWTGDGYGSRPITLRQVKVERFFVPPKTNGVAMYERISNDGTFDGFEVFQIKLSLKGDVLPNGSKVENDKERHPSCSAFGRYAWHILKRERADKVFDSQVSILKSKLSGEPLPVEIQPIPVEEAMIIQQEEEPPLQQKKLSVRIPDNVIIPENDFTIVQFGQVNNLPVPGKGYLTLRALLADGIIVEAFRKKVTMGRGKPTIFYRKA